MQSRFEVVRTVASQYPATLTHEQCALIVNEVAWLLNKEDPAWGLSAKPSGKNARLPNGVLIAEDILHYWTPSQGNPHGVIIDILAGAPERNEPVWIVQPYHGDPSGRPWLRPFDPASFEPPTPSVGLPQTELIPPGIATLNAKLDRVLTALERLPLLAHNSTLTAEGVQRLEANVKNGIPMRLRAKFLGDAIGIVGGPQR